MKTKLILASILISSPLMAFHFQPTEYNNNSYTTICVKSESEGSGTKSESEGSGTKSESEGSGTKSESEGSGTSSNQNCYITHINENMMK